MTRPQTDNRKRRLTTSEMVVYPMIVVTLIGVAFGFYHNSKIEDAVAAADGGHPDRETTLPHETE